MQLTDAIHLIQDAGIPGDQPAAWADLGCGSGLFTHALAHLLPEKSTIYAVDKTRQHIDQPADQNATISFTKANFKKEELPLPPLQGILMANSLHYVKNKNSLLERLREKLLPSGVFILVEYDSLHSNPWVPYPIDFSGSKQLLEEVGCTQVTKLGERPSRYRQGNIYAIAGTLAGTNG